MFGFNKKKNLFNMFATQNGEAIELSKVPDEAFASKMLGDGIAIIPNDNNILSPVDGTIIQVTDTLHAYGIQTETGLDVLVHIGINTVELKGEGFKSLVKEGDKVKVGTPIATADLELIKEKGYETYTPIIITNVSDVENFSCNYGNVIAGKDVIINYTL